jgi:hypothetical protein
MRGKSQGVEGLGDEEGEEEAASGSLNHGSSTLFSMGIAEARDPSEMSN